MAKKKKARKTATKKKKTGAKRKSGINQLSESRYSDSALIPCVLARQLVLPEVRSLAFVSVQGPGQQRPEDPI